LFISQNYKYHDDVKLWGCIPSNCKQ